MSAPEIDGRELRAMLEEIGARLAAHIDSLPEQPSAAAGERAEALAAAFAAEAPPEQGRPLSAVLDRLLGEAIPASINTAGPGYLAYVPGGGIPAAALADLIAGVTNRYVGARFAAPALAELERGVIRWMAQAIGLPEGSSGVLTTGGSMSIQAALAAARASQDEDRDLDRATLYFSDQAHYAVPKAGWLVGLRRDRLRAIESGPELRMRLDRLVERIAEDRRAGLWPMAIVGTAGSTGTGAIDDLEGLARLAKEQGCWLHVDAAYGGFFALTERGRRALAGIEAADSVTLDPHKGLFLPYGTGALLVRSSAALRRAHRYQSAYFRNDAHEADFSQLSPELSRDFRGLRIWLPLQLHGVAAFRAALEEKLDLAAYAAEALASIPGMSRPYPASLSIVPFRLERPGWSPAETDRKNRALLAEVNAGGRVYLSGVEVGENFVPRMCVLSFRTHREHVETAVAQIAAAAERLR